MTKTGLTASLLSLLAGTTLGATLLHEPLASAAAKAPSFFVSNDAAHAVPVREQNLDGNGSVKVHEQGTARVEVTNESLPLAPAAPVTGGGGGINSGGGVVYLPGTATALMIHMTSNVVGVWFRYRGKLVAYFSGPATGDNVHGQAHFVVPLPRAITWDQFECRVTGGATGDQCLIDWIGNEP